MNSIAINSIKTSVVLGGFQLTPMRRTRGGRKDKGQEVAENPVNSRHGSIDECNVLLKASRLNPSLIGIISNLKLVRTGVGSISKSNDIGIARDSGVCKQLECAVTICDGLMSASSYLSFGVLHCGQFAENNLFATIKY